MILGAAQLGTNRAQLGAVGPWFSVAAVVGEPEVVATLHSTGRVELHAFLRGRLVFEESATLAVDVPVRAAGINEWHGG